MKYLKSYEIFENYTDRLFSKGIIKYTSIIEDKSDDYSIIVVKNNLYDEDDYVLLHSHYYLDSDTPKEYRGIVLSLSYHEGDGWQYDIMLVNSTLELGILEYGIDRKMTPEEIKQVKIESEANKYNI